MGGVIASILGAAVITAGVWYVFVGIALIILGIFIVKQIRGS